MSTFRTALSYWPRRSTALPPGQREVSAFPRFSDEPFRWAPALGDSIFEISIPGDSTHEVDLGTVESDFVERTHDFHCVTTWSYRGILWGGYGLRDLCISDLGIDIQSLPQFAAVFALDDRYASFRTQDLLDPSVMLATERDGLALDRRHGGAIRLVSPLQYGYKSAKHVKRIEFFDEQPVSSFGKKEHLRARVREEERHSSLPNWLLRVPYRLTVVPTALAADRGLAQSPIGE